MITKTYQPLSFGNAYYAFSCFHKAQDLFWAVNSLMQDCKKWPHVSLFFWAQFEGSLCVLLTV